MKQNIIKLVFCLLWITNLVSAQSENPLGYDFLETTTERDKFLFYLDSIDKYMYRDVQLVETIIKECELIVKTTDELTSEDVLEFNIQKIYIAHNNNDLIKCYHLVKECEALLQDETISDSERDDFEYIRAFTYMELEDWGAAREGFNEMLEKGRLHKDTATIIRSLFSLGQLYADEGEYDISFKCYDEGYELGEYYTIRGSTLTLMDLETAENYIKLANYEKAKEVLKQGLLDLEARKMARLKPDFLLYLGDIELRQGNLEEAEKIFIEMDDFVHDLGDQYAINASEVFHAKLLSRQKKYTESIQVYDSLLATIDTSQLMDRSEIYKEAQADLFELGELSKAYAYLKHHQELETRIVEKSKKEKRNYYKTKFGLDQKERENQSLSINILKEQHRNRILYFVVFLFILGLLILYGAFRQKRKFNRNLRKEIKKQTQELADANEQMKEVNQELVQFNRILSHDLKEPMRSIVGFSALAQKENVDIKAAKEYMKYVETSGRLLSDIIQGVSVFQDIGSQVGKTPAFFNLDNLAKSIVSQLKKKYTKIPFEIRYTDLPTLLINGSVLRIVFYQLLDNAIKFNRQPIPKVTIRYYQAENQHHFELTDNGVGIEENYHTQVFDMFKRLNNRKDYEGSGLGLSIVKKMLDKMNGSVTILKSVPLEGSTFLISIPVIEEASVNTALEQEQGQIK